MQKDSWAIDYQATKNVLDVAREKGAAHFVLLSAICVEKPLLEFQHAKLKLEEALQTAGDITYSIVRPTAFFKSLAGQVRTLPCSTCNASNGSQACLLRACKTCTGAMDICSVQRHVFVSHCRGLPDMLCLCRWSL